MALRAPSRVAQLAVLGFALSQTSTQVAQAYYSYAAGWLLLSATTTSGIGTTVLIVYLVIKTVDFDSDEPGAATRRLIDAGLLASQGDLAMQLDLLRESPTALSQAHAELTAGSGPAVDALVAATGLPPLELQRAWTASVTEAGLPASPDQAHELVVAFLGRLGPQLQVDGEIASGFAWALVRERADPTAPASGPAHQALATWLGLSVEQVAACSAEATLALSDLDDAALHRGELYADADPFLDALSRTIATHHAATVDAQVAQIVAQAEAARAG